MVEHSEQLAEGKYGGRNHCDAKMRCPRLELYRLETQRPERAMPSSGPLNQRRKGTPSIAIVEFGLVIAFASPRAASNTRFEERNVQSDPFGTPRRARFALMSWDIDCWRSNWTFERRRRRLDTIPGRAITWICKALIYGIQRQGAGGDPVEIPGQLFSQSSPGPGL